MAICRERTVPCWPTTRGPAVTLHSGAVTHPAPITLPFVTSNTPGDTQKGSVYCFLLTTAFPASHSSSTGSRQPVSKTTAPPSTSVGRPWPPGLGAGAWSWPGEGEGNGGEGRKLATFILARILQVPSPRQGFDSATQEECAFPGDTETCFHKRSHRGLLTMERCLWFG